jgi:hypothetical protein
MSQPGSEHSRKEPSRQLVKLFGTSTYEPTTVQPVGRLPLADSLVEEDEETDDHSSAQGRQGDNLQRGWPVQLAINKNN